MPETDSSQANFSKKFDQNKALVEKHGWILKQGFYIDNDELELDWNDRIYLTDETFNEYKHPCEFWQHKDDNGTYGVYTDLDDLIEDQGLDTREASDPETKGGKE